MSDLRPSGFQAMPMVVKNLLIINGLMYLATVVVQNTYGFDLSQYLGLFYFTSEYFKPHQLISHMFMHGSIMHIFSNMFALWMFGSVLENVWGPKRFLIYYLICGIGGALTHMAFTAYNIYHLQNEINLFFTSVTADNLKIFLESHRSLLYDSDYIDQANKLLSAWSQNPADSSMILQAKILAQKLTSMEANIPVVGASGAVFGVLLAFGMLFPNTYLYLMFPPIPIKAKYFVILYGGFELYAGVSGTQAGVAHFAHLGGMLFGFIMIKYWNKKRRQDFF
jgi:membrane associated rhomboid family serine protease